MRRAQSMLALATALAMHGCTAGPRGALASPPPALFDSGGYRLAHYRAPVGGAPSGVENLSTAAVRALLVAQRAILIDVMPAEGGHRDPHTGRWTLAVERLSLPGSHWFPEAGRAPLAPQIEETLRRGVALLRARRPNATLIVFCRADCWMSWNAARRLRHWGYRHVAWYGPGTDGWTEESLPLYSVRPAEESGFQ